MVGVADHGNRMDRFPIYEPRNYEQVRGFLSRMRQYGGTHDLFLSLDLRIWPKRTDLAAQERHARDGGVSAPRVSNATLAPMLAALQPTRFAPYDDPPICSSLSPTGCLCKHGAYPGWWDQMAKNYACFTQVIEHERASKRPYDFLVKVRSDFFVGTSSVDLSGSAEVLLQPMVAGNKADSVWVKGWGAGSCYGQGDWLAVVPRHLAFSYFTIVPGATCAWMEKTAQRVRREDSHVAHVCPTLNERALVEWVKFQGSRPVVSLHDAKALAPACALRRECAAEHGVPRHADWCKGVPSSSRWLGG